MKKPEDFCNCSFIILAFQLGFVFFWGYLNFINWLFWLTSGKSGWELILSSRWLPLYFLNYISKNKGCVSHTMGLTIYIIAKIS
jgi:hypothetical protein